MRFARLRILGLRAVPAAILLGGGVALLSPRALPAARADGCPLPAPALPAGATAMPFNLDDLLAQVQQAAAASEAGSHLCLQSSTGDGSVQLQLTLDSSSTGLRLRLTVSDASGTGLADVVPDGGVVVTSGGHAQALSFPATDETGQSLLELSYDLAVGPVRVAVHLQVSGARLDTTTVIDG
jgi:hypothetical protein